jgi:hypothetical protein
MAEVTSFRAGRRESVKSGSVSGPGWDFPRPTRQSIWPSAGTLVRNKRTALVLAHNLREGWCPQPKHGAWAAREPWGGRERGSPAACREPVGHAQVVVAMRERGGAHAGAGIYVRGGRSSARELLKVDRLG